MLNILSYFGIAKSVMSVVLAVLSVLTGLIFDTTIPHSKDTIDMSRFELTWSDEFDGDSLDLNTWKGHYGNKENCWVRRGGYWSTDLCTVKDGSLHIETKYLPDGLNGNGKAGWYTAGIDTSSSFGQTYGYFECRCILPKGIGQWAAFWMFSSGVGLTDHDGEKGAEIDVFESAYYDQPLAFRRNKVSSNIHINGYGEFHRSKNAAKAYIPYNNPYENYNLYGLEWNENEYIFYVNGVETGRTNFGVSRVPEWLILSTEVGGEDSVAGESWAGRSIETEGNEITDFIIDYVRVYQYKDLLGK